MKTKKITLNELRNLVKTIINESSSLSHYEGKWYENLHGLEHLHKYPQDFIDWLNEDDTWAESYTYKHKIDKIITLFDLWVNEKY